MILSRITKAVREQNWFAVAIEFVIVITGVVIGFQVSAWNEARIERNQASELLVRLEQEFEEMRVTAAAHNQAYSDTTVQFDALLDRLEDPADPISDTEAGSLLNGALMFRLPPPMPLSMQDMLAAGRLELLRDASLARTLREFAQTSAVIDRGASLLATDYLFLTRELSPYIGNRRTPDAEDSDLVSVVETLDVAALRQEAEALALVNGLYAGHANMRSLTESQLASIDVVLAALEMSEAGQ
jgi:hypothetical protein